jgi:nucleotide-binding universal stress UspA family protein
MYKKILVPLDGSPFSEHILTHVKTIASGCKASEVVLLFVMEPFSGAAYEVPAEWLEETKKRGLDFARDYLKKISVDLINSGIVVTDSVKEGIPAETILTYAQTENIDLIVISTHGRSGIPRWVIGSVADKVIHLSTVPVLIVAPAGVRTPFKN